MPMLDVDGSSLYYIIKGEGIPIIFIHPPTLTCENFKYQFEELSRDFKVIAFDVRGHGKSSNSSQEITYSLIAKDIKTLLAYLKIKNAFICGYSTGSSVALEFLLTYKECALGGILIGGMSEVRQGYLKNKITLGVKLAKVGAISFLAFAISWGNSNTNKLYKKCFEKLEKVMRKISNNIIAIAYTTIVLVNLKILTYLYCWFMGKMTKLFIVMQNYCMKNYHVMN